MNERHVIRAVTASVNALIVVTTADHFPPITVKQNRLDWMVSLRRVFVESRSYMFKLRRVRSLHIDQWCIRLNNSLVHQVSHLQVPWSITTQYTIAGSIAYSKMIVLDSKTFEISATENQAAKIGVYSLEQRFRGGEANVGT